jgi:hypothetical protein
MAGINQYRKHYVLYVTDETPSGFWEINVTISDTNPNLTTALTYSVKDSFLSEKDALSFRCKYGIRLIDTMLYY